MTVRRITVADIDPDPTDYPILLTVRVAKETGSAGDRARVQVTATNSGEDMFEFQSGFPGVFGGLHSEERDPGLFLYPPGSGPPIVISEDEGPYIGYPIPGVLMTHELAPGSSESVELDVLSENQSDPFGWLPEGTFTFRYEYTVGSVKVTEGTFEWGFSLDVESIA